MKIHRYDESDIYEFDTLDELRKFDERYVKESGSKVIKEIAEVMHCQESDLTGFCKEKHPGSHLQFTFKKGGCLYRYNGFDKSIIKL